MKIIAGNFKSNLTRSATIEYLDALDSMLDSRACSGRGVYIFPSNSSLTQDNYKHITIGAQNCNDSTSGAFTGETSLLHLQEFKINTILIGHSERRNLFFENDEICARKFDYFKNENFKIFYCIGESLEIRESGKYLDFLKYQLGFIDTAYANLVIAYEPIWAIGTGLNASVEQIEECINYLKGISNTPIIYGGSVSEKNSSEILKISDGVLVGGASLDMNKFYQIIKE